MYIAIFFNDTATTEIYTLSLHDALPIYPCPIQTTQRPENQIALRRRNRSTRFRRSNGRSEEHTSELQSRRDLVCRLLLEKKKNVIAEYFKQSQHSSNKDIINFNSLCEAQ